MFDRISSWAQRNMPTREQMAASRWVPNSVLRSDLWRFNRRSVPRGVALGLLVGIIVPFAQIIFAALFSLSARANVPVAALTTFVTNPFTTPFIWAFSHRVGAWLLHADNALSGPIDRLMNVTDAWSLIEWLTTEGRTLALGLIVVAIVSAAVGYLATALAWRAWVGTKWRRRSGRGGA